MRRVVVLFILLGLPALGITAENGQNHLDLTHHWIGYSAIGIFLLAYLQFFGYYLKKTYQRQHR